VEVRATWHVPVDVEALAVTPHMHHLGRDMTMSVTFPGGLTEDLISIRDWDPAWQHTYDFEKPMYIPKGSVVKVVAHFDNSSENPRNPHQPPKLVTWGEGANDEMCIGYIAVVKNGQDLTRPGEKDDLFDIFVKQRQNGRDRRLRASRGR
ncbi:monooxygenase, partial [Singulisphaera rosea]